MPAALDVNKEEVRMLVLSVGVREAARQMGLNEKTVLHWSMEGKWLAHTRPQPIIQRPASMIPRSVVSVKPADALKNVLEDDSRETRISLSKSTRRLAKQSEQAPLEQAGDVLQVAKAASLIHGWAPGAPQTGQAMVVNISVLGALPDPSDQAPAVIHELPPESGDDY